VLTVVVGRVQRRHRVRPVVGDLDQDGTAPGPSVAVRASGQASAPSSLPLTPGRVTEFVLHRFNGPNIGCPVARRKQLRESRPPPPAGARLTVHQVGPVSAAGLRMDRTWPPATGRARWFRPPDPSSRRQTRHADHRPASRQDVRHRPAGPARPGSVMIIGAGRAGRRLTAAPGPARHPRRPGGSGEGIIGTERAAVTLPPSLARTPADDARVPDCRPRRYLRRQPS
jgi:hypothetical protein